MTTQVFFTVAGASAIFITVSVFIAASAYNFVNRALALNSITSHLINSVAMVFEMVFNSMIVRFEHIILLLSWAFLYIVYIWSMAATDRIPDWPYPFLATSTPSSYFFYGISYVLFIVFFLIWYAISWIKISFRGETIKPLLISTSYCSGEGLDYYPRATSNQCCLVMQVQKPHLTIIPCAVVVVANFPYAHCFKCNKQRLEATT